MKKLLAVALVLIFTLCSCSSEKIEGKALEKYLEIIDSLECGTVFVTSDASSNKATIQFRQGKNGCEILATTKGNDSEFVNYFDGLYLYSGTDELTKNEAGELDPTIVKRNLIGAPDYAIDSEWYDEEKSGIYKTLTGYKIMIVTHEEELAYEDNPDTTLTLYLDKNMVPTKATIEDEIFGENMRIYTYKTTLKYDGIGIEPRFVVPTIAE